MTTDLPGVTPCRLLASAIVLGALCVSGAFPALAADAPATGAPPNLDLSAPGVAWAGFVAPKAPDYAIARAFNDFTNPATGLGPVTDGPAHPYVNNEVALRGQHRRAHSRVVAANDGMGIGHCNRGPGTPVLLPRRKYCDQQLL